MKKVISKYFCDVCGAEIDEKFLNEHYTVVASSEGEEHMPCKVSVVFLTEQTEGLSSKPYLEVVSIHLCKSCYEKIVKDGKQLFATGAQGYNQYFFKESQNK